MSKFRGTLNVPVVTSNPGSGTAGQVIYNSTDGNYYAWDTVASAWNDLTATGAPGAALSATAQSTTYTAVAQDLVLATGTFTVTLPTSPAANTTVGIIALTGVITVSRGGTNTINVFGTSGQTSITLFPGQAMVLQYLSGVWYLPNDALDSVPRARRSRVGSATSALVASTDTAITLPTSDYATGLTSASSGITIPTGYAGIYSISAGMTFAANSSGANFLRLWKNNVLVKQTYTTGNALLGSVMSLSTDLSLTVGDVISLAGYTSVSCAVTDADLSMFRVSR